MKKTIAILLALAPGAAFAQPAGFSDKGIVYYVLGADTTVVQYFEYAAHNFKTTFIQFTGAITKCQATGTLDADGDISSVTSTNYRIGPGGNWELTSNGVNAFNGDSTIYTATSPGGGIISRRSFPGKGILANGMDIASFYVFPYIGFYAPAKKGDTLFHRQLSFNGFRKYTVSRTGKNELRIGSSLMGYLTYYTGKKGRLQKINGTGSSLNFMATVDRTHISPAIPDAIAIRRNAAGATVLRMQRDTARLQLNGVLAEVDYWRPYRRGREIFGHVVPWNRVWRTGANNATQLRISGDVNVGGIKLPKGIYGVWSYITETDWQIIINKNATAWGTDHDPAADIGRVPLKVQKTEKPVEIMKITLRQTGDKTAELLIEWDMYKAGVQIEIQ